MSLVSRIKKEMLQISKFIDFDKEEKVFYNNLYLRDIKMVVKMPFNAKKHYQNKIRIEKFDLTKYCYLCDYD